MISTRIRKSIAIVLFALVGAGVYLANDVLRSYGIVSVRVTGDLSRVDRDVLKKAVGPYLDGGLLEVDVDAVREAASAIAWVRAVTVRRVWPDRVDIRIVERTPVAVWNEDQLLEADASLFSPQDKKVSETMVRLSGPAGQHANVLMRYKQLALLFGTFGGGVTRVSVATRGSWDIGFGSGMTMRLGPNPDFDELRQYAKVLPKLFGGRLPNVLRIDLRYANGFAVRWRGDAITAKADTGRWLQ